MDGDGNITSGTTQDREGLDEALRRLIRLGATALSTAELVALLLRRGRLTQAAELSAQGVRWLLTQPAEALIEAHGLEAGDVARLLACGELSRRFYAASDERPTLRAPADIYAWARPRFFGLNREAFHALYLNNRGRLLRHVRISEGSVDQCQVDPREVLAPAVVCRASSIVLLHNHPSGDPEPSVHDVALTRQLREAARLLCVRLADHLVVCERGYVSLLERGLLGATSPPTTSRLHAP